MLKLLMIGITKVQFAISSNIMDLTGSLVHSRCISGSYVRNKVDACGVMFPLL